MFNVEIIKEATEDSIKLYKANGVQDRAWNICGDASVELKKLVQASNSADLTPQTIKFRELIGQGKKVKIILDPPRKGISKEVADTLNVLSKAIPFELIYISCNPATLSRDIANLTAFTPTEITPYDMFPHTSHVESVVCLTRK